MNRTLGYLGFTLRGGGGAASTGGTVKTVQQGASPPPPTSRSNGRKQRATLTEPRRSTSSPELRSRCRSSLPSPLIGINAPGTCLQSAACVHTCMSKHNQLTVCASHGFVTWNKLDLRRQCKCSVALQRPCVGEGVGGEVGGLSELTGFHVLCFFHQVNNHHRPPRNPTVAVNCLIAWAPVVQAPCPP